LASGNPDTCSYAPYGNPIPKCIGLQYSHAHNDYEHAFPLFEALSHGFVSAEADIFLYDEDYGILRVAHDPVEDPNILPIFEELYLDPLVNQFHFHDNGGIYADGTTFHLLVDIKTEGESTYARLHEILEHYAMVHPGFITSYHMTGENQWDIHHGAVNITISGNRPRETMLAQEHRYATYDGRIGDLGTDVSPAFLHLLSDNWNRFFGHFEWDGIGMMPQEIKDAVKVAVDAAHSQGRIIRFWNLPRDDTNIWGPLVEAGVDFVNTDRLAALSRFLERGNTFAPFGKPLPSPVSYPFTHAHNDYEHTYPLYEALSWGFVSGEADIFLYDNDQGNLRVAHDPVDDPTVLDTIQELYLDPLAIQYHFHDSEGIYNDGTVFHLLVDIKTEGEATYARLHEVLGMYASAYPGFLTTYYKVGDNEWMVEPGAVNVTISGNRPRETMLAQSTRYATYDGRMADIGSDVAPAFLHLLSDNWNRFFGEFGWDGVGEMPVTIQEAIVEVVHTVHAEGRLIRFWNLPSDDANVWGPLIAAGVDFVNTDRLGPLSMYVQEIF